MSTLATQVRARRLTAEFLQSLRTRGMLFGVDDYQMVQELLLRLPADTEDATLGNALVALFATTPEEQRSLQGVFATSIAHTNQILAPAASPQKEAAIAPPTPDEVAQDARDRSKLLWAGLPLLLILLAAVAYYLQPRTTIFDTQTMILTVGEERALPGLDMVRATIGTPGSFDAPEPASGEIDLRDDILYYQAGQVAGVDSTRLLIRGTWNRSAEIRYRFRIDTLVAATSIPDPGLEAQSPKPENVEIDLSPLPLPYPRSLADLTPKPDTTTALDRFLYEWWWLLVGFFFISCLVFLFSLLRYFHRRNQRLVARRDRLASAPHFWRIRVPDAATGVDFGETYPLLVRQLRQRREADHRVLDVAGTINATIHSGGMPTFAYKGTTRPSEYLLLIDRGGADNHRAQLFELLYQRLHDEEVLIERYFYDGDPRFLYQDDRGASTTLPRVRNHLPNAQLILVGTGDQFLNASNGRPSAWAIKQLAVWGRPSLLTPRPHNDWGRRERHLDELLNILPATIQGLGLLTSRLTAKGLFVKGLTDYRPLLDDLVQEPVHFSGDLISSLREVFDETKLKWIAGCALYPSLHWELTLYLGSKTGGLVDQEILTSRNVLELCRLPWFVKGEIPEPARIILTEWLRSTYPKEERKTRTALLQALNQAEPPVDSVADQELTFQRLQNQWMLATPNSPKQARLANQIAEAIEAGGVPDATVVKYLSEPLGHFDIPLDDKWKKRLYPGGLPGLGWRKGLRQSWLVFPLLVLTGILGWWWQPEDPSVSQECDTPILTVMETGVGLGDVLKIQICSREDSLLVSEYRWQKAIAKAATVLELDSLVGKERLRVLVQGGGERLIEAASPSSLAELMDQQAVLDTIYEAFRENIGAMIWNRGLKLEGGALTPNEVACEFYQVADSLFRNAGYALGDGRTKLLEGCREEEEVAVVSEPTNTVVLQPQPQPQPSVVELLEPAPISVPRPQMQTISAATFLMGDTFGEGGRDERPVHEVTLSAFELARYELTFEEYDLYCDSLKIQKPEDEGWGRGRRPVINVNWFDAVKYCNWLSEQHGYTPVYSGTEEGGEVTANWSANGYRLPTEAEWEYAAAYRRDGTKARFGNGQDTLRASEANFDASEDYKEPYSEAGEYREKTLPVGSFSGNGWGLKDMAGNVYEWCWDWHGDYGGVSVRNPRGPVTGSGRVFRGGSWFYYPVNCRACHRYFNRPTYRAYNFGFRLARGS